MNPQETASVRAAAQQVEDALKVFEDILENTNNRPLYEATSGLVKALASLHEMDPLLLSEPNRLRVEAANAKQAQKARGGRDTFNTGF